MYSGPPLQHPRPKHLPSQIPSTSPPPPEASTSTTSYGHPASLQEDTYQRFSSPPVNVYQQGGTPDVYIPAGGGPAGHVGGAYGNGGRGGFVSPQPMHGGQQQQGGQQQHAPWSQSGSWGDPSQFLADPTTQMGVQFTSHAFQAGTRYLDTHVTRLLPLSHLKHSFNVSNGYVLRKIGVVLWPWRHGTWARQVRRNEVSGVVEGYRPPRDDINCPDLYIPVMALTTYILLSALLAISRSAFTPQVLGSTASKAFAILFLEFLCIKVGCYLLGIGDEGTVVDLFAYEGYKFVGIIVALAAALGGVSGWMFYAIFFYTVLANFFFLLRSLRHIVLPDPSVSPLDSATSNSPVHAHGIGGVPGVGPSGGAHRSKRIQFLFAVALGQTLSMGILVRA